MSTYSNYTSNQNINRIGALDVSLKDFVWSIDFNFVFKSKPKPFKLPRLRHVLKYIGIGLRYKMFINQCKKNKLDPYIDFFNSLECKQIFGVPIGTIGSGTIGRTYFGDFCRYCLVPGIYEHDIAEANLFTVCVRKNSSTVYQQALSCRSQSKLKGLNKWKMNFPKECGTYHALYPESWTVYNLLDQNLVLTCHQLSPMIPHNYKDSSLPVALFDWTIENNNNEEIEFSLMFTWQSGSCTEKFDLTDVESKPFNYSSNNSNVIGVLLNQKLTNMPLEYFISANNNENCEITYCCQFYPNSHESGTELWETLMKNGNLNNKQFNQEEAQKYNKSKMAIAVCAKVKLEPFSKKNISFSLVFNMPKFHFVGNPEKILKRFHTRYFPAENPYSSLEIACYSQLNKNEWLKEISKWREPILKNKSLPNFYKCCLFNELYFLADGGTVWINVENEEKNNLIKEYGLFAYMEGHEYRMYNTYDVHFYASFALIKLWPKLQLSLQYDMSEKIDKEIRTITKFIFKGETGALKLSGSMPHDLGDPMSRPWENLNAYIMHNTNDWKDLNLKFILSVYRDYYYLKDNQYLENMWPFIKKLMLKVQSQDNDSDGLIDSKGEADQTYDTWFVTGPSAYCGGLHLATLKVVCEIAMKLNDSETFKEYSQILLRAKESFEKKLWNGRYYNYDSISNSIMADMCCGHWFLRSSGFKYEVFEKEKIKSCLETIYDFNVIKYGNEKIMGAVNGMKPNGNVDTSSLQSEEVWVGITDSLASLMIFEDMPEKAWKTIEGMYDLCYNELGLAFQMPEALLKSNLYRSLGYMRPLCIWSIQFALEAKQ